MHVKNALIISLQIMRSFPVMEPQGIAVTEAVEYAKVHLDGMQYPDVLAQLNGYACRGCLVKARGLTDRFQKQLESSRKRAMAIKSFNAGKGESDTWLTPTRFHQVCL
jgi:Fe-S cluster biogenesis protein NfuA